MLKYFLNPYEASMHIISKLIFFSIFLRINLKELIFSFVICLFLNFRFVSVFSFIFDSFIEILKLFNLPKNS